MITVFVEKYDYVIFLNIVHLYITKKPITIIRGQFGIKFKNVHLLQCSYTSVKKLSII